ncbi:erythromycin esterase family protein [Pontibacter locisalis]|uniref:Erythromycin esterase family protein n=1 Tax=Pontibacter locisalis TaxID=1719035 RepID=A0ABW5IL17_9BACT
MSKLKKTVKWTLYVLLAALVAFFFERMWVLHLQREIAPQIAAHIAPLDFSGTSRDTAAFHESLYKIVDDKSILGFGEATHGTAEFERAFALITKKLIREKGFNVVVFAEMNFADTWALNHYVLQNLEGDEAGLHTPHAFLQEDRIQLIEWIRAYNSDKPPHEKVWFLGADVNTPNEAARNALLYCEENNITLPSETHQALTAVKEFPLYSVSQHTRQITPLEDILNKIQPLYRLIQQGNHQQDSLNLKQLWLYQSITNLNHALRSYYAASHSQDSFRDSTMYSNIKWVLKQRPEAKMLVYAHNVHIAKKVGYKDISPGIARLGWHLNQHHRDKYAVIGTEAWKGRYIYSEKEEVTTIAKKMGKIGTAIAKATNSPAGLLHLNATPALREFFNRSHTISMGIASPAPMYSRTEDLAEAFDGVFYIRESTPLQVRKLYGFNMELELDKERHRDLLQGNTLRISCTTSYSTLNTYQAKKGVELSINYLNEDQELIDYEATQLLPEEKLTKILSPPDGTAYIRLRFSGTKVKDFSLTDFTMNGVPVRHQDIILYGERYKRCSSKKFYQPESESIHISLLK